MIYTIAFIEEMASHDTVSLVSSGNKYYIELVAEGKQAVRKHFDNIEDAVKLFQKFAEVFATGCYSYKDRASWLAE